MLEKSIMYLIMKGRVIVDDGVRCPKCGREHLLIEACHEDESLVDKIPWWAKAGAGSAVALAVAGSLPATVTTLAA